MKTARPAPKRRVICSTRERSPCSGDDLHFGIAPDGIHPFDPESGSRIGPVG